MFSRTNWSRCVCLFARVCVCVIEQLCSWTDNPRIVSSNPALTGILSCPSISSHTSPPSCDGDLEFSGVQIHWPWLVNQLRVQVGLQVPTPISRKSWSIHLRAPSSARGVCLYWLIVTTAKEFAFVCACVCARLCVCVCAS